MLCLHLDQQQPALHKKIPHLTLFSCGPLGPAKDMFAKSVLVSSWGKLWQKEALANSQACLPTRPSRRASWNCSLQAKWALWSQSRWKLPCVQSKELVFNFCCITQDGFGQALWDAGLIFPCGQSHFFQLELAQTKVGKFTIPFYRTKKAKAWSLWHHAPWQRKAHTDSITCKCNTSAWAGVSLSITAPGAFAIGCQDSGWVATDVWGSRHSMATVRTRIEIQWGNNYISIPDELLTTHDGIYIYIYIHTHT